MPDQHRAMPEQWESIDRYADSSAPYSCILELRARIEALEAAQQPHQDKLDRLIALDADDGNPIVMPTFPADSLIDRVAQAIYDAPNTLEGGWHTCARAAILEVAAWLRENPGPNSAWPAVARDLMDEANR